MIDVTHICISESVKHDLLTPAEEIELGAVIQETQHKLAGLNGHNPSERARLEKMRREAMGRMVKANTRLSLSIARKYYGHGDLSLADLFQEANIGLIKAAQKYDPERGCRFSTYATWWIRQSVCRALPEQGLTIRLPVHRHDQLTTLAKTRDNLAKELGIEPRPDELAEAMGVEEELVNYLLTLRQPESLDRPLRCDDDTEYGFWIEDEAATQPEKAAVDSDLAGKLRDVLLTLPAREAQIIKMRFGLEGYPEMTLEAISQKFSLTRERIRQIEGSALKKLRHPRRSRRLR